MGSIRPKYAAWIKAYRDSVGARGGISTAGLCGAATAAMVLDFPELRRARGYARSARDGWRHTHWWCVAAEGEIVDPTADQFDVFGGVVRYEEHDDKLHGPLPMGKCPDCGNYVYEDDPARYDAFCNRECHDRTVAYLNEAKPRG